MYAVTNPFTCDASTLHNNTVFHAQTDISTLLIFLQVTIDFDQSTVEPKSPVQLTVTADEGSLVNVLAVDKSVILLADGNDITPRRVCTGRPKSGLKRSIAKKG